MVLFAEDDLVSTNELYGYAYRLAPAGNIALSGSALRAANNLGIKRVLTEPASRGDTK
jgi:hypothetical protein